MPRWAVVLILMALLVGTATVAWWVWQELAAVRMSEHGLYALLGGSTLTILLAVGLMVLVFISHRRGFDDEAGRD